MGRAGSNDVGLPCYDVSDAPAIGGALSFAVLDHDQALAAGLTEPISSEWDSARAYASYLAELRDGVSVGLIFTDASAADAPEDMTLDRALSFLLPLLNELGEPKGRRFAIVTHEQLSPTEEVRASDEERSSRYLVELDAEGKIGGDESVLWADHYAFWAPEDLTLERDFAFIAPLLNDLVS